MTIEVSRSFSGRGITVPYAPIFDDIRKNHGFLDVRGQPNLAAQILEGHDSEALRALLVRIAREGSYFSLGCDLGAHVEDVELKNVAGGYLQIASTDYANTSTDHYDVFCDALAKNLEARADRRSWRVDLQGAYVQFRLPGEEFILAPSIWIWFFAAAKTCADARKSREGLICVLEDALHATEVRASFVIQRD